MPSPLPQRRGQSCARLLSPKTAGFFPFPHHAPQCSSISPEAPLAVPGGACASPEGWFLCKDAQGAGHVPRWRSSAGHAGADPVCSQALLRKALGSVPARAHPEWITCFKVINLFAGGTLKKLMKVSACI